MDLRTRFVAEDLRCDWLLASPQLDTDDGLETAVIISLFTDGLADPDDVLPDNSGHRRGWWGDSFAEIESDRIGSKLWLLSREKQLTVVLQRVRAYARDALHWLIEDGIARAVEVEAEFPRIGVIAIGVTIQRAVEGPLRFRFETFWDVSNAV